MPRNMHFGPARATSIDLCAYDFVRASRYAASTVVVAEEVDVPFEGVELLTYPAGNRRRQMALIREARPDLVVVHQHLPSAARIARGLPGVPVLAHRHNSVKAPSGRLSRFRHAWRMRKLAGLIFVSDFCRREFQANWGELGIEHHVVHNALDLADWVPTPPEARRKVIAYAGRADRRKGVVELAEALSSLLPRHPDWRAHLMLAASESDRPAVERIRTLLEPVQRQVTIEYDRSFADVRTLLCEASVAAVPTVATEAFGRAALEAMAGGAALVASTRGGLPEVAGEAAILLDQPTAGSIEAGIGRLLADPGLRNRLAEDARKRSEALFDLPRVCERLDAIYDGAMRGVSGGMA